MRLKNLRGSVRSDLKKLDSFTLETSKNQLIRSFLRNGHLKVKSKIIKNNSRLQNIKPMTLGGKLPDQILMILILIIKHKKIRVLPIMGRISRPR